MERSNGVFVDDSARLRGAAAVVHDPARLAFCQLVLSRVPQRLDAINKGLRTLHFYQIEYSNNPDRIAGGTQDNGSWETLGDRDTWINVNIADGGHNALRRAGRRPQLPLTAWQQGQLEVSYNPQDQVDANWISDTLFVFYGNEAVPFIGNAITDPVTPGWIWTGREHVFRSTNYGRNPALDQGGPARCTATCGRATATSTKTAPTSPPRDLCDDFQPLGDPGPTAGASTNVSYGADRAGGHVALVERGNSDTNTLWAATSTGRLFISKNADDPPRPPVTFTRIDTTAPPTPPRYPTAIFVDPQEPQPRLDHLQRVQREDAGHARATSSRSFTPATAPRRPRRLHQPRRHGLLRLRRHPGQLDRRVRRGHASSSATTSAWCAQSRFPAGTDGAAGLPSMVVSDLVYVPEQDALYAATHGQGVWRLELDSDDDDRRDDDHRRDRRRCTTTMTQARGAAAATATS